MATTRNANRRRRLLLLSPTAQGDEGDESSLVSGRTETAPDRAVHNFCDACGATGPIRLQVFGPGLSEPQEYSFHTPYVVIGHGRKANLRLNHPDVSLRHAYLQMIDGRLYCVDLHSRTGTSGRDDIGGGEVVVAGETIQIGPFQVEVLDGDQWGEEDGIEQSDSDQFLDRSADELARVTVEVINGDKRKRFRAIESTITLVGNAPECQLRLRDRSISKTHCALVRTPEGLWCVDLLGRRGTRINTSDIRFGQLRDGDLLKIGKAKIRMHYSHLDDSQIDDDSQIEASLQSPSNPQHQPTADAPAVDPTAATTTPEVPEMGNTMPQMPLENMPMGNMPMPQMPMSMPQLPQMQMPMPTPGVQLPQTTEGSTPAERQVSEAFVMTLVNQFGEMQQQMFQQSQQSMMMLVNMFGTLHQNHMDLIRDDLNRIYEITGELQAVQAQMVSGQAATNVAYTREQQHAPEEGVQDAVVSEPPFAPQAASPSPSTAQKSPQSTPSEAPPAQETTPGGEAEEHQPRDRSGVRTHAWLNEQLSTLENERASRWSKIMETIKGIGGGV